LANDFSGDPNCKALWKFDNNANDSKGGNDLTAVNSPSYDSGDKKEGTHSIDLEASSVQYLYRADADLDAGFPGKSGTGEQSFSICVWVNLEQVSGTRGIVEKLDIGSGHRTFALYMVNATLRLYIGYNSGANYSYMDFDTGLSAGVWYHIAVVYDASDNGMKLRVWDDNAGALLDDNKEGMVSGDMSPTAAPLEIGRHNISDGYPYDGKIDEVVFFNDVLTDDEIDQIRAGTYGAVELPVTTAQAALNVVAYSATANGTITDTGGENCDKRGFAFGKSSQPDPGNVAPVSSGYDDYVEDSGDYGVGAFDKLLSSLDPDTTYYYRAYAHNSAGYDYSDVEIDFTTMLGGEFIPQKDAYDGYRCYVQQHVKNRMLGVDPWKLPDGTKW
jgi:hypothetical protein